MTNKARQHLAGAAGGAVNGLFGGGGGMVLLPLLTKWCGTAQRTAFASSVAVMAPISAVSAGVSLLRGQPAEISLLPYLLGAIAGGIIAGLTFERVSVRILKGIFGLFLLYGGVRYLL